MNSVDYGDIKFFDIKNIAYADESGMVISCIVSINDISAPEMPFNAAANDVEEYGRKFYDDLKSEKFGPIEEYEPPILSKADIIEEASAKRNNLLSIAAVAIAPLQDAADLDIATTEEQGQLLAWKKYRVLLNRVDTSTAPDIEWPQPPETKSDQQTDS